MLEVLKGQRTYALIGHGGCGKTTVAEMLLHDAGVTSRLGKIEEGTTALDYEPEEIKRRGSTQPGLATYLWNKNRHFLIDAPGDLSFNGDLRYLLSAVDAVFFVIDAVDGVKPLTKKLWQEVTKMGLPAVFVINKMDRDRADFDMALNGIRNQLGVKPFLQNMPIGRAEDFKGVVNVVENKAYIFEEGRQDGRSARACRHGGRSGRPCARPWWKKSPVCDEALMERYLEDPATITIQDLFECVRRAISSAEVYPVMCTSGLKGMGGKRMLNAAQLFFSLAPGRPGRGERSGGGRRLHARKVSPTAPVAAFVFKTLFDPFAGPALAHQGAHRHPEPGRHPAQQPLATPGSAWASCSSWWARKPSPARSP